VITWPWRREDPSAIAAASDFIDLLNRDELVTPAEAARRGNGLDASGELADLFVIARQLKVDLAPVAHDLSFEAALRARLLSRAAQRHQLARPPTPVLWRQPRFIVGAATVGSLLSVAAVLALVVRGRSQARLAA